ncbi:MULTISPECIES: hypothetical protein [Streptomyces]|uniref:hypothetical protein n=1 Tax=Streptomyces TaxID=1883 RepID=UPI003403CD45
MVGVTWTDPALHVPGAIEVRTRLVESGQWSRWLRLDGDSGQGESGAARGGTEPAWVGPSDGIGATARVRISRVPPAFSGLGCRPLCGGGAGVRASSLPDQT